MEIDTKAPILWGVTSSKSTLHFIISLASKDIKGALTSKGALSLNSGERSSTTFASGLMEIAGRCSPMMYSIC